MSGHCKRIDTSTFGPLYRTAVENEPDMYKIVPWHGESATLFYVVDVTASDEDQPAVMMTAYSRETANEWIERNTR